MGIRPLADGWRRVAIRPLPGKLLRSASVTVLTPRGVVGVAFDATASTFSATVTVPGNTIAQICLPRYVFGAHAVCTVTTHNNAPIRAENAGALLCLRDDVGGGTHSFTMTC
jgi:alpha-L-rhamnosidase